MLRPSILAAALMMSPAPASVLFVGPGDTVVQLSAIQRVVCIAPDKNPLLVDMTAGTAFRVGNGILLSVNHVTSTRGLCSINGKPISVWFKSARADFSMLHGDDGPFIKVDCGGFVKGRKYVAIGFARGLSDLTSVELTGTGESDHGMAILEGIFSVVPGQSGGPVIDAETGEVVGTVNMEDFEDGFSLSVPLSDTPVCKGRVA